MRVPQRRFFENGRDMSNLLHRSNFRISALLCFILILSLIGIPATLLTGRASANVHLPPRFPRLRLFQQTA